MWYRDYYKNVGRKNLEKIQREPVLFFITREGFAYFKDAKLNLICDNARIIENKAKEDIGDEACGYDWVYNYSGDEDRFRRYIKLMELNNKHIKFIGITQEEFYGDNNIDMMVSDELIESYFSK